MNTLKKSIEKNRLSTIPPLFTTVKVSGECKDQILPKNMINKTHHLLITILETTPITLAIRSQKQVKQREVSILQLLLRRKILILSILKNRRSLKRKIR